MPDDGYLPPVVAQVTATSDQFDAVVGDVEASLDALTSTATEIRIDISDESLADTEAKIASVKAEMDALGEEDPFASMGGSTGSTLDSLADQIDAVSQRLGNMMVDLKYDVEDLDPKLQQISADMDKIAQSSDDIGAGGGGGGGFRQLGDDAEDANNDTHLLLTSLVALAPELTGIGGMALASLGPIADFALVGVTNLTALKGAATEVGTEFKDATSGGALVFDEQLQSMEQDITKFLSSSTGIEEIDQMVNNGNAAWADFEQAVEKVGEGIIAMGASSGPIVEDIGKAVDDVAAKFDNWASGTGFQNFLSWIEQTGPEIAQTLDNLGDTAEHLFEAFGFWTQIEAPVLEFLSGLLNELTDLSPVLTDVIAAVLAGTYVIHNWGSAISGAYDILRDTSAFEAIVTWLGTLGSWIMNDGEAWNAMSTAMIAEDELMGESLYGAAAGETALATASAAASAAAGVEIPIVAALDVEVGELDIETGGAAGALIGGIGAIAKLASGGIVTSPTLAVIGEDGPEAVLPLSDMARSQQILGGTSAVAPISGSGGGSAASGGVTINAPVTVTVSSATGTLSPDALAQLTQALQQNNTDLAQKLGAVTGTG